MVAAGVLATSVVGASRNKEKERGDALAVIKVLFRRVAVTPQFNKYDPDSVPTGRVAVKEEDEAAEERTADAGSRKDPP